MTKKARVIQGVREWLAGIAFFAMLLAACTIDYNDVAFAVILVCIAVMAATAPWIKTDDEG